MMNWVGGARKRIKLNDEKKQQEAFFKQRRIDAALKKYKPQASSVNAELSQDVLHLKFIQKQFSNINNNSTVAEKVIQPGYDPSLRGTPARRVVAADQNAVFPDQINKQYNKPFSHSSPTEQFKNVKFLSFNHPERSLNSNSFHSTKSVKLSLNQENAVNIVSKDIIFKQFRKQEDSFRNSENLSKQCKQEVFFQKISKQSDTKAFTNTNCYGVSLPDQCFVKEKTIQQVSFKTKCDIKSKHSSSTNVYVAAHNQNKGFNPQVSENTYISEMSILKNKNIKEKGAFEFSLFCHKSKTYQLQKTETSQSSFPTSSVTNIEENAVCTMQHYKSNCCSKETVDYSNISKNHNWQNQSSPHLPYQCQSILKTTATSTLITVEKRSVKKSVTFHDTLIHSSQAPSPMKPYSAHVYEIPDGENQSFS